jgi:hypothetical protein
LLNGLRSLYLARFHTESDLPPEPGVGLLTFRSSPANVTERFESVPAWFGNKLPSMCTMRVLLPSSTDQVPNWAVVPCTTA